MTFETPQALAILVMLPLLIVLWLRSRRKTRHALALYTQADMLHPGQVWRDGLMKLILTLGVLFLSVVALMRPIATTDSRERTAGSRDILFALDTSRSMSARDVQPGRIAFSRGLITDFVRNLKGDNMGIMAFAGSAFLLCPMTTDYDAFLSLAETMDTGTISRGGTSLRAALEEAAVVFGKSAGAEKILIVLTDGEDHEGGYGEAARKLSEAGVKVIVAGIGTQQGDLVPAGGGEGFHKDGRGNVVRSRLREETLREVAALAGGRYATITEVKEVLKDVADGGGPALLQPEGKEGVTAFSGELFQVPLALAVILLLLEPVLALRRGQGKR